MTSIKNLPPELWLENVQYLNLTDLSHLSESVADSRIGLLLIAILTEKAKPLVDRLLEQATVYIKVQIKGPVSSNSSASGLKVYSSAFENAEKSILGFHPAKTFLNSDCLEVDPCSHSHEPLDMIPEPVQISSVFIRFVPNFEGWAETARPDMIEWEYRAECPDKPAVVGDIDEEVPKDVVPRYVTLDQYLYVEDVRIGEKRTPLSRSFLHLFRQRIHVLTNFEMSHNREMKLESKPKPFRPCCLKEITVVFCYEEDTLGVRSPAAIGPHMRKVGMRLNYCHENSTAKHSH